MCCKILEIGCWVLLALFVVGLFARVITLEKRIGTIDGGQVTPPISIREIIGLEQPAQPHMVRKNIVRHPQEEAVAPIVRPL
jgi:hypothetical protein